MLVFDNRIMPQRKDCDCPCHDPHCILPHFSTCGAVQCCYPNDPDPMKSKHWTQAYQEQLRLDREGPPPPLTLAERLALYKAKKA